MSLVYLAVYVVLGYLAVARSESGGTPVPLLIYVAIGLPAYLISLVIHPYRRCWWCDGSGRHLGLVFRYSRRPCRHCGGLGTAVRLGRILRPPVRQASSNTFRQ